MDSKIGDIGLMATIDIDKIAKDEICQKWITYCMAQDSKEPVEFFEAKQDYWESNQTHLEENGFHYSKNIGSALDEVSVMKDGELEGNLLVVKLGNDLHPASPDDINLATKMLKDLLDGVKGVRAIVVHHLFDISKISLPQLRFLQSAVMSSTDLEDNVNPILDLGIDL